MNITEQQEKFILLAYGECMKFTDIVNELNISYETVSKWYEELKSFAEPVSEIRRTYTAKKVAHEFTKFYDHIKRIESNKRCSYCGISEMEMAALIDNHKVETKRTRGRKLELDRKDPNLSYNDLDNLVWACYWCNNAKTDTFTYEEFLEIGKSISKIWKQRQEK